MRVISLQSGSNGNCIFVQARGARLLFDAGISGVQAQERLAAFSVDPAGMDGLLISHDHSDHVRCAGIFHRKFQVPVYATPRTLLAARRRSRLGLIDDVRCFRSGESIDFGEVVVETIPTPHDGVDGVGFVVDDGCHRLGILTDLGHVFAGLTELLQTLDAVLLESNYDPRMLADGPYPEFLKQRIQSPQGHLSNCESAGLLNRAVGGRLKWACLAHLSEQNNDPDLALATHRSIIADSLPLYVASRHHAIEVPET